MPHNTSRLEAVATIGIDIGKNTFHLVGLDRNGAIVLRQKLSRRQIEARLANTPPCLIGMEACVGAHHLSRQLKAYGHDARSWTRAPRLHPCSSWEPCRLLIAQLCGRAVGIGQRRCRWALGYHAPWIPERRRRDKRLHRLNKRRGFTCPNLSSASRSTASHAGFLLLSQAGLARAKKRRKTARADNPRPGRLHQKGSSDSWQARRAQNRRVRGRSRHGATD